ncbi:MAG: hypothetical protein RBR21_13245, partial [Bacteroidales bacterium]|nr:hypothetical protein [Bacteroidales bacterium]
MQRKRKSIVPVVSIATLALLGLIAIQLYWMQSAIHVQQDNFNRKISETMRDVARVIEKIEISEQLMARQEGNLFINRPDSVLMQRYQSEEEELNARFTDIYFSKAQLINQFFEDLLNTGQYKNTLDRLDR